MGLTSSFNCYLSGSLLSSLSKKRERRWSECTPIRYIFLELIEMKLKYLGVGSKNLKTVNKPSIGHFMKNDIPPKQHLKEF